MGTRTKLSSVKKQRSMSLNHEEGGDFPFRILVNDVETDIDRKLQSI
uniref:Uncharacterized protein n=1 Tax=Rhizophora mucronata TaxID=61149 RepID=A0A2P2PDB9_RHIMU